MADQVPPVVKWLHEHLLMAQLDLNEYKKIFTSDDKDLEVLNSSGRLFFIRLHRLYWGSFIQTAGRLMDRKETMKRPNASLDRIVHDAQGLPIHDALRVLKSEADGLWEPMKKIRNEVVAHSDLERILKAPTEKLNAQTSCIERLYAVSHEMVDLYYRHFEQTQVSLDLFHPPGVQTVLDLLRRGKADWDRERERLISNSTSPR